MLVNILTLISIYLFYIKYNRIYEIRNNIYLIILKIIKTFLKYYLL